MLFAFYTASAVAIVATVLAISGRNPVHALLNLVVSLLAVAVVLFLLGAPFAAALEVIVYAGAIMVLFLFVIMMLSLQSDASTGAPLRQPGVWVGPSVLAAALLAELLWLLALGLPAGARAIEVGPKAVGIVLLGPYLLAVELGSMLLLAGLVGAWHLGRPRLEGPLHTPTPDRSLGQ